MRLNAEEASKRIRHLIDKYCGGSQQELADRCGVSKNSVSQWVNGVAAPGNYSAIKIGQVFGVNPMWAQGEDVPMYKDLVNIDFRVSEVEQEMLHQFRALAPDDREIVSGMIKSLYNALRERK